MNLESVEFQIRHLKNGQCKLIVVYILRFEIAFFFLVIQLYGDE